MAKGNGGTRNNIGARVQLPSYATGPYMTQLGFSSMRPILQSLGNDEDSIAEARRLLNLHSEGGAGQDNADNRLYELINDKSSQVGKALRGYALINETQFRGAMQSRKAQGEEDDITVYRGGNRKNTEAWTTNQDGADVGSGIRIGVDHRSTIKEMLKTHYLVGGISQMVGAPGESEILFIKKRK